jgi:hypothetical protein
MREQLKKEGFNSYRLSSLQRQTALSRSPTPPAPPPAPESLHIEQPVETPETPTQEFATLSATNCRGAVQTHRPTLGQIGFLPVFCRPLD